MYVSAHTHVLMYTMHACRCKNTCICTYMHMFICTHVYLYTQIFLYTRVHACVCTHTQKIGLWITEYPKALPRNGVKFKKPSYTQKRLFWKGTQEPRRTEKGRRNIMSFSLKENKAHSWNFLKKEFYPQVADLEDIFTHVNEISLSISCLEVATTLDVTENSQVFSPELLMQTETQATIRTNAHLPLELPPRWRRDTKFSVSFFEMIKQETPGNSSNIWPILFLPQMP